MRLRDTSRVAIAGAGLAGTLLAVLLAKRGFRVDLFERNGDQRRGGAAAGRSINLALAERGRHALQLAGLLQTVDEFTIPMRGRLLHAEDGGLTLQRYGKDDSEVIHSTHRALLNNALLDAAEATGNLRIHFRHKLNNIDWDRASLSFEDAEDGRDSSFPFDVLIGADGGGSAVRKAMNAASDLGVSEELLAHGYRELTIPGDDAGGYRMEPHALHIWPRGGFMLIALPNADGSFTATLFLSNAGRPGFEHLGSWPRQRRFMQRYFPDVMPLWQDLRRDFRENPVGLLGTVRCKTWHLDGRAALIGDAAHAVVPFHGQGMNAAFEDCVELATIVEDRSLDWRTVFEIYQRRRIDNANAIADMALENYLVMREAVRDPHFLLRKQLEHELERRHPGHFIARYSMVMFHRIPYAEAYRRGAVQADLLDRLLAQAESLEEVDFSLAARLIGEQLAEIEMPA